MQHLVILGDLFDFWFEYRDLVPKRNLDILFRLREFAERGVKISYVCGNHDFWIGDFMTDQMGFEIYRDQMELDNDGQKVLVIHGDGVAPSDWKYRILKRVLRNRINIALYKLLPPGLAYGVARRVSHDSREYGAQTPPQNFLEEYYEYARRQHSAGYSAVICGHLHHPEIKEFESGIYVNCGDWLKHFTAVSWDGAGFTLHHAPAVDGPA